MRIKTFHQLRAAQPFTLPYPPPQRATTSSRYTGPIHVHPLLDASAVTYNLMQHPSTVTVNKYSLGPFTNLPPPLSDSSQFSQYISKYTLLIANS